MSTKAKKLRHVRQRMEKTVKMMQACVDSGDVKTFLDWCEGLRNPHLWGLGQSHTDQFVNGVREKHAG